MREDDERRRQRRLLFVLHDDAEPVELPDLVRERVRVHENGVEHGDQQVQQQDIGHLRSVGVQRRGC